MELVQMKKRYTIQENGQVTLPAEWRDKFGLKKGDEIVFEETDQGLLISPREAILLQLLDDIGDELRDKKVTLEALMQDGREIRGKLLKEMYGIEPDDAQE
jgi:AbrB family looped-hinge helix DNA binding protein